MALLTGPALAAALLLSLAGAQKLLDPTMTVGALRGLGVRAGPGLVRLGSGAELVLGVAAVVGGQAVWWWLVSVSYLAFSGVVLAALRRGAMIGSCGCFGREETPPHVSHLALNLVLAGVTAGAAVQQIPAPLDSITAEAGSGVLLAGMAALAVALLYVIYVEVPRALRSRRLPAP